MRCGMPDTLRGRSPRAEGPWTLGYNRPLRRLRKKFVAPVLATVLIACRSPQSVPPLPNVELRSVHAEVRKTIEESLRAANAEPRNSDKTLRLGMVLHAHNLLQAASQCYARAHVLAPENFDVLYYWGQALASNGEYPRAAERLRQALAIRPDSVPVRLKLAEVLRESGDRSGANLCRGILDADPKNATAHYELGRALEGEAAAAELQKALLLFPSYGAAQFALAAEYRRAGKQQLADRTLADYERDKMMVPPLMDPEMAALVALDVTAAGLQRRARLQEAAGRLDDALALERRAIAMEPDLADAWIDVLSLCARLNRDAEAVEAYHKAVSLAPGRAEAYYNYGVLCLQREHFSEAKAALQKSVDLAPRYAEALHNLGVLVEREGKWDQAAALYRRALDVKSAYPIAHYHLGRIYANRRDYRRAIAEFEQSLDPRGDSTPAFLYALAATHARAGNRRRALELMEEARRQAAALGQDALVSSIDRDLAALRKPS